MTIFTNKNKAVNRFQNCISVPLNVATTKKVLNKNIFMTKALLFPLFLPPSDFTAVKLQVFKNIFFPEQFSMALSKNSLKQSILVHL